MFLKVTHLHPVPPPPLSAVPAHPPQPTLPPLSPLSRDNARIPPSTNPAGFPRTPSSTPGSHYNFVPPQNAPSSLSSSLPAEAAIHKRPSSFPPSTIDAAPFAAP